jgi:hypothetical protein
MRKWAIWIPVLMVASLLYWTVALGLGGLSLIVFGLADCAADVELGDDMGTELKDSYEPTTVRFFDAERAAADEAPGRGIPIELVEDRGQGSGSAGSASGSQPDRGPGITAF